MQAASPSRSAGPKFFLSPAIVTTTGVGRRALLVRASETRLLIHRRCAVALPRSAPQGIDNLACRHRPRNHGRCARKKLPSARCAPAAVRPASWCIAPTTAAATRSKCQPINGRMRLGIPILSRGLFARLAASGAPTCDRISIRQGWGLRADSPFCGPSPSHPQASSLPDGPAS
jgi:hypothetical protein